MLADLLKGYTDEEIAAQLAADPDLANWYENLQAPETRELTNAYFNFVPRPDDPARFDQQHSFCYNRDPVSFMIGGNAAGTTECAAFKTAKFLLRDQPPPRADTPFWIISNTYEQVGGTIWKEKFLNHGHIPRCEIEWERISWRDQKLGHPAAVPLKPWPEHRGGHPRRNWTLHFKSFDQGREAMQAASIGGFFFSEQFPLDIFLEVLRGCREYMFPGGQFAEFTPIDPELCLWVETIMDEPPPGWKFYRANTEKNKSNLREGWFEQFFAMVPEELMETRMTGALAIFAGTIFQSYSPVVHVKPEKFFEVLPQGLTWGLGTDWGASEEHPHASVLGAWDGMGDWYIPDEYWSASQSLITSDHARKIVEMCKAWGWPTVSRLNSDKVKYDGLVIDDSHRMNYADPSRPGEILEFTMWGVPSAPANNRVYDGINTMRTLFRPRPGPDQRPRIIISERCIHLKDELRKYRWKKGRKPTSGNYLNPTVAAPVPLKRDDDTVDATRYLLHTNTIRKGGGVKRAEQSHPVNTSIGIATGLGSRSVQLDRKGR